MRISPATLLAAAESGAKPAPKPEPRNFAAALEGEGGFQPLTFKSIAAPQAAKSASVPAPQNAPARCGSLVDIKV